jgi:hypothetical protein
MSTSEVEFESTTSTVEGEIDVEEEDVHEPEVENWHPITGFAGYSVSNWGNVRNDHSGRVLSPKLDRGYFRVGLSNQGQRTFCQVHRLVVQEFIGPIPEGMDVDHIDHNRTNNRVENLRIVSRRENLRNKSSTNGVQYTFDTELPVDAIIVDEYNGHHFTNYYYHDGRFWFFTGKAYKRLHINTRSRDGLLSVWMYDDEGVKRGISIATYRRFIGEIV